MKPWATQRAKKQDRSISAKKKFKSFDAWYAAYNKGDFPGIDTKTVKRKSAVAHMRRTKPHSKAEWKRFYAYLNGKDPGSAAAPVESWPSPINTVIPPSANPFGGALFQSIPLPTLSPPNIYTGLQGGTAAQSTGRRDLLMREGNKKIIARRWKNGKINPLVPGIKSAGGAGVNTLQRRLAKQEEESAKRRVAPELKYNHTVSQPMFQYDRVVHGPRDFDDSQSGPGTFIQAYTMSTGPFGQHRAPPGAGAGGGLPVVTDQMSGLQSLPPMRTAPGGRPIMGIFRGVMDSIDRMSGVGPAPIVTAAGPAENQWVFHPDQLFPAYEPNPQVRYSTQGKPPKVIIPQPDEMDLDTVEFYPDGPGPATLDQQHEQRLQDEADAFQARVDAMDQDPIIKTPSASIITPPRNYLMTTQRVTPGRATQVVTPGRTTQVVTPGRGRAPSFIVQKKLKSLEKKVTNRNPNRISNGKPFLKKLLDSRGYQDADGKVLQEVLNYKSARSRAAAPNEKTIQFTTKDGKHVSFTKKKSSAPRPSNAVSNRKKTTARASLKPRTSLKKKPQVTRRRERKTNANAVY